MEMDIQDATIGDDAAAPAECSRQSEAELQHSGGEQRTVQKLDTEVTHRLEALSESEAVPGKAHDVAEAGRGQNSEQQKPNSPNTSDSSWVLEPGQAPQEAEPHGQAEDTGEITPLGGLKPGEHQAVPKPTQDDNTEDPQDAENESKTLVGGEEKKERESEEQKVNDGVDEGTVAGEKPRRPRGVPAGKLRPIQRRLNKVIKDLFGALVALEEEGGSNEAEDLEEQDSEEAEETEEKGENEQSGENRPEEEQSGEDPSEENGNGVEEPDPLLLVNDNSASRLEWIRQKAEEKIKIEPFDNLMRLIGRENVKAEFLSMKAAIDARRRRGEVESYDFIDFEVEGNEGTGRDTIRGLYSAFRVLPDYGYERGSSHTPGRRRVLWLDDFTEEELHELIKKGLEDRSMRVEGADSDPHLYTKLLAKRLARRRGLESFRNRKEVTDALAAACDRQADRLQRERLLWKEEAREKKGDISEKEEDGSEQKEDESERKEDGGQKSDKPDYLFFLTKEDLLGFPPTDMRQSSNAYQQLQAMTGLDNIKSAVEELMDLARRNYHLEIKGNRPIPFNANRIFMGPAGSGKTTVAKHFGQIVIDLGLVSQSEIVVKDPSDFISQYLGGEEANTRKILTESEGKVLIIDDAHGLCFRTLPGHELSDSDLDLAKIHDTIVAKTSTEPGQDRCILLVGYSDKIKDLLERSNPGLRSRFPLEDAFEFHNYEVPELMVILEQRLASIGVEATEQAKHVASRVLARARVRPGFGNARDVHNLVNRARAAHKETAKAGNDPAGNTPVDADFKYEPIVLQPADFDPHWERETGVAGCADLFQGFVGFEDIIEQLQGYQEVVSGMRIHGQDPRPHIPFTFVFKGPPGTGKTSTARKLGQIFYDMGFLDSSEVIECSASDLIGQFQGNTAPLVQGFLEKALGKVLFIDEAYRLYSGATGTRSGSFEDEAVGELVDGLTKERYIHKIVVILAGYSEDMDLLMRSNRGLRSRFTAEVLFPQLTPKQALQYLGQLIGKMGITIFDARAPSDEEKKKVYRLIKKLSETRDWSNGRDIETLASMVVRGVYRQEGKQGRKSDRLIVSTQGLISHLQDMLRTRLAGELVDRD
ncbi:P-loop containing nucleoside triphosphate hydrolase protein [Cercophora samala]|uniref:P-loop containing nucleoside triphosphate hydrolase protein n=1 Tax=Cercophora samala TaxID=330535 RepID=A0AA40D7V8_9PEZI|nr:P-loop containing nucleoside triphosphate hydrolase protein [Cercophora samala]